MKAAQFERFGGPGRSQDCKSSDPHPGSGDIRIAVMRPCYASDWKKRQGLMDQNLPQTLATKPLGLSTKLVWASPMLRSVTRVRIQQ